MSARLPALKPARSFEFWNAAVFASCADKTPHVSDNAEPPHLVTVPFHTRDLKPKTLRSIIRQAGWTEDEFIQKM